MGVAGLRVSFAKLADFHARGPVHFHAVICTAVCPMRARLGTTQPSVTVTGQRPPDLDPLIPWSGQTTRMPLPKLTV